MELPDGIEKEILEYLHLEYGEDPSDDASLKLEDIVYEGLYDVSGIPTHYWRYAPEGKRRWATVEPFGDSYAIGMTTNTPTPIVKGDLYKTVEIEAIDDSGFSQSLPLESWGEGSYGFSDYKEISIPGGEKLQILAEAHSNSAPPSVTLSIKEADVDIYIRGSVGLALSYKTKGGITLVLSVGTGPWE